MTLASKITLIRVAFIPVYMVLMYVSNGAPGLWMWLALGVFIIASLTDFVDGQIARKFNQVSDFGKFLELIKESGYSSYMYFQNVIPAGYVQHQDMAVALGLCQHYLQGKGAYRVHGGGFAGTVQAFVPFELLESFRAGIEDALGAGACHVLSIRPQGGVEMDMENC